jgi:glutamate/tyrosine decarboxylase-like PLP-dependent enzyme
MTDKLHIPASGLSREDVIRQLKIAKENDVDWANGRSWSLVYYGGEEHTGIVRDAYDLYFSENAAGPAMFPSLRRLESEVISMMLGLLGSRGEEAGSMTSGGTESILLAMKAYRDQARERKPEVTMPEILVPESAHPAFLKAAHFLDLQVVPVPLDADYKADIEALRQLITPDTTCLVASAPTLSQGVVDPIASMGEIALEYGIGLHVDACLGGFLLPFMDQLGYNVPAFDFRVPGVTSISMDLHKNGYAAKGASAVLYRETELRRHQYFVSTDWQGGAYASPTMMGTRAGGAVAAAWASMMALGWNGYLDLARRAMDTVNALIKGISALPGLSIVCHPDTNVFAFCADDIDVFRLGARLDSKGWRLDRQNHPRSLRMIATPNHMDIVPAFLKDLQEVLEVESNRPSDTTGKHCAFLYGNSVDCDSDDDLKEMARLQLDDLYSLESV